MGHPSISIICEKLTYVGVTRFEDDTRLPLGIAVNSASYAAKALTQVRGRRATAGWAGASRGARMGCTAVALSTVCACGRACPSSCQVAVDPRFLKAYMQLGAESDLMVQDASAFAAQGEALSFLQLQARAASVRQVLLGYYRIPGSNAKPLDLVVNPQGLELRSQVRRARGSHSGGGAGSCTCTSPAAVSAPVMATTPTPPCCSSKCGTPATAAANSSRCA